jgi:hypothetical protein
MIQTIIILKTQFSNIYEGDRPASLTYTAEYAGDDQKYLAEFENNLVDEVATQCDFWECVTEFKEGYSVQVRVLGNDGVSQYSRQLTELVTTEIASRLGRPPGSSFWDDMTEEQRDDAWRAKYSMPRPPMRSR